MDGEAESSIIMLISKLHFLEIHIHLAYILTMIRLIPTNSIQILKKENFYLKDHLGIVNAAIPASGIADWLAYLQDYGNNLDSQIIVLGIKPNIF